MNTTESVNDDGLTSDALIRTIGSLVNSESSFRVKNACDKLLRYGSPYNNVIIDVLETLTDINDNLCNDRHERHILKGVEKAKDQLMIIARESLNKYHNRIHQRTNNSF